MFEEFYEMYEPEEQEVVALINRCIGGGFNWKGNFWEMTVVTLGVVFCDTGKVTTKEERLEFPDQEWVKWAELYSFMDVQEMTWKRKKLLSLMAAMDNYSDYLLLWSPRDKKLWYLDIEHEEFHPLAKWDDFIADPGRYLNGMIEGEFEE